MDHRIHSISIVFVLMTAGATGALVQLAGPGELAPVSDELAARLAVSSPDELLPVIVQLKGSVEPADAAMLRDIGFTGLIQYEILPAVYGLGDRAGIEKLRQSERVEYIEYDTKLEYYLDTATTTGRAKQVWDATFNTYVGGVREVHAGGISGAGVNIAIIDTGVDSTHRDLLYKPIADAAGLPAKTTVNLKILGRDSVIGDVRSQGSPEDQLLEGIQDIQKANALALPTPNSDNTGSHGTHVAGIAGGSGAASGGSYRGAAPGANIVGLGCGETLVIHLGLAGFDWVYANADTENIRIVSNSWGGAGDWNPNSALTKAIQKLANDKGTIILFAAGNDGGDGSAIRTNLWANIPEVTLSVANYNEIWGFANNGSSRGKTDLERTWPDLMATGTRVRSTAAVMAPLAYASDEDPPTPVLDPYTTFTGTSMATPFVAGVVALMLQANPALTAAQVKEILRETATPVTYLNATQVPIVTSYATHGHAMGKGLGDAARAVAAALRLADGSDLATSIRIADVDSASTPWVLNQPRPLVSVGSPAAGDVISGTGATISGVSSSQADPVTLVEVAIDSGQWAAATGTSTWSYILDTTALPDGTRVVRARAFDGTIHSFEDTRAVIVNNVIDPPTVVITSPDAGDNSAPVGFNGSLSTADPGRVIVTYAWDFGDGVTASTTTVSHTYALAGAYDVKLTVTDDGGLSSVGNKTVVILDRTDLYFHAGYTMDSTAPTAANDTVDERRTGESVSFTSGAFGGKTIKVLELRAYLGTSGENSVLRFANPFNVTFSEFNATNETIIGARTDPGTFTDPLNPVLRVVRVDLPVGHTTAPDASLKVTIRVPGATHVLWRLHYDSAAHPSEIVAVTTN